MFEKLRQTLLENKKNRKILITVVWVGAVFLLLILAAGSGNQVLQSNESTEFDIGEMVFGTIVRLVLVLALIYGIFSIYQLFQKKGQGIREKRMSILDIHRFSTKQMVVLMKVDDQDLLIGVTDHQITLLKDMGLPQGLYNVDVEKEGKVVKSFHQYMDEKNEQ
jgi:flagellar biogenesis protein FliO